LIRLIATSYSHINLLGICFGAQIISRALGGKVENMEIGLVNKNETYQLPNEFYELSFVKNLNLDPNEMIRIMEVHEDQITELPPTAKLYSRSNTANVEIYGIGENILGWQGHPDYAEKYVCARTFLSINENEGCDFEVYEREWLNERRESSSQKETLMICEAFLKKDNQGCVLI